MQDSNVGENDGGSIEEAHDGVRWVCTHGGEDGENAVAAVAGVRGKV